MQGGEEVKPYYEDDHVTLYPVTQWEAAIRRVQDILEDAEEQP